MSFTPHPALRAAHAQTIFAAFAPRPAIAWERERVELDDGDFVDLDHAPGPASGRRALVLHGLGGSSEAPYVRGLTAALAASGWGVTAFNFRGASGEPNRLARTYHSGDTADVRVVARLLRARVAADPLVAVGFSMGANALLKLLGEDGARPTFDAAVAVSSPFVLRICAHTLARGLAAGYGRYLLRGLKRMLRAKRALVAPRLDLRAALGARDFAAWDELVTAPLNGFASAADYWARASSSRYVASIAAPTLILHARDDPFMTPAVLPSRAELPPRTVLEASARGGHVGFVARGPRGLPRYHVDERVAAWLGGMFGPAAR
ncbi:MAG: alpha/beta fold hydrolase [Deltaproteobacteria bacterium]|nr:alpha/beta fold hydrolase [Deltaproteobacteria bacterium]